jgi:hypothetical protein
LVSELHAGRETPTLHGLPLFFLEEFLMTDLMLMRQTPVSLLRDWLAENTNKGLRMRTERDIILQARLEIPAIARMDNGDIAWEIHQWAEKNSFLPVNWVGTPGAVPPGSAGATPVRAGDPEILDNLKALMKTLQSISNIKWVGDGVTAGISVSGLTADFGKGSDKLTATVGWDRTLELKTCVSGMTFSGKIDPVSKTWDMEFTIGKQAPNLADVANVFQQGESALRGVLSSTNKIDFTNPSKTVSQFSPYIAPIKAAVDAASKIAAQRPGSISFGVSLKGGPPTSTSPGGVTATALFTVVF